MGNMFKQGTLCNNASAAAYNCCIIAAYIEMQQKNLNPRLSLNLLEFCTVDSNLVPKNFKKGFYTKNAHAAEC